MLVSTGLLKNYNKYSRWYRGMEVPGLMEMVPLTVVIFSNYFPPEHVEWGKKHRIVELILFPWVPDVNGIGNDIDSIVIFLT